MTSTRLDWCRSERDSLVHGWTGEWECGWPIAACSFSCPPCEVVRERSDLCPGCVLAAEIRGVPTPVAESAPAKRRWHRRTVAALVLSHLAAFALGLWATL